MRAIVIVILLISVFVHMGQGQVPPACSQNPTMANTCAGACVICDIDGFTGTNDLQAAGQAVPGFCSTPNDMHFIAFIAGSSSLSIRIDVTNCTNPNSNFWRSLDLGLFESLDCSNFDPITTCREDLENGDFFVFNTTEALTIGQHYYLIMDGSFGSICDWTFSVLEGSTVVSPLGESNPIAIPNRICANQPTSFSVEQQLGATVTQWFIDDEFINIGSTLDHTFTQSGLHTICLQELNSCNLAPESCETINVFPQVQHDTTFVICEGDLVEFNGFTYDQPGVYPDILIQAQIGCDTIANLTLEFGAIFEGDDLYNICDGDTLFLNDQVHFEEGVYDHLLQTEQGCDSIVHVTLGLVICNMEGISEGTDLLCFGDSDSGSLTFSVTAGTPPFTYEYIKIFEESTINGSGTIASDFEDVKISGLSQGTYLITINDTFGNFTILTEEILEPDILSSTITTSDYNGFPIDCHGTSSATASVFVEGGISDYAYSWSFDGLTTSEIDNIPSGSLFVTVTDFNDCELIDTIQITEPDPLILSADSQDPNCDGLNTGSLTINQAIGGVPRYTYRFEDNGYGDQLIFTNLDGGTYSVFAQDANGCIDSLEVNLTTPEIPEIAILDDLTISLGDTILLDPVLNDITTASTTWTPNNNLDCPDCLSSFAFPVNSITYTLSVTSQDGCTDSESINIAVNKNRDIYSANIFSPVTNGIDSRFSPLGGPQVLSIQSLSIFDRWGNLIFNSSNLDPSTTLQGWDGTFDDQPLNPGVYVWKATAVYLDGFQQQHTGTITLIR